MTMVWHHLWKVILLMLKNRLLQILPEHMVDEYLSLWQEFEAGVTDVGILQ